MRARAVSSVAKNGSAIRMIVRMTGMWEIAKTRTPKIATVTGRLDGGTKPIRGSGHNSPPESITTAPKTTYSAAKIAAKILRNAPIRLDAHVAPARSSPVIPRNSVVPSPRIAPSARAATATASTATLKGRSRLDPGGAAIGAAI